MTSEIARLAAASHQETVILSQGTPYWVLGARSGTGTGFSPTISPFLCQYNSTNVVRICVGRRCLIYVTIDGTDKAEQKHMRNKYCLSLSVRTFYFIILLIFSNYEKRTINPITLRNQTQNGRMLRK